MWVCITTVPRWSFHRNGYLNRFDMLKLLNYHSSKRYRYNAYNHLRTPFIP